MAPQLPQPVQSFWLPETKAAVRVILPEHIIASLHSSLSKRNTDPSIPFPIEVALDDRQQHPRQPQSPHRMVLAKRDDICSYDPVGGSYTCDWGWYCSGPRSCTRSSWYTNRWWFFAAGVLFLIFLILLWRRIIVRRRNAAAVTATQTTYIPPVSGYDTAVSPYPPPPGPVPPSSQLYGAHPGTPMQTFEYRPDPAANTTTANIAMVPMAGLPHGQKPYDDGLYSHYPPKDNLYPPANHSEYQAAGASSSSSSSPAPPPEYTPSSNTPYPPGSSVPPKS